MNKRGTRFSSFSIISIFVLFGLIGLSLTFLISIRFTPDNHKSSLSINYQWNDVSPRIIESTLTSIIEDAISFTEGIKSIKSKSYQGRGVVNIVFDKKTDIEATRLEIAALIRQLYKSFPGGVSYPSITYNISDDHPQTFMILGLNGDSYTQLKYYAEEIIQPKISKIEGINKVNVNGINNYEYLIICNPDKLRSYGLELNDISDAITLFYQNEELGKIEVNSKLVQIRITGHEIDQKEETIDLNKISICNKNGELITLDHLATFEKRMQTEKGYKRINGLNGVNIDIETEKGVNQLSISKKLNKLLSSIKPTIPKTLSLNVLYDSTKELKKDINTVAIRTLLSLIILLLFTYLINRDIKYVIIIITSLIINLLIAIILYYLLKIDIHIYSLAGLTISLGIIIDNSIIMIDNLIHQKNRKVFTPILAATLTTIGALSVIFFLNDDYNFFLLDFAWIIIVNLFVSLITSLFFIPALFDNIKFNKNQSVKLIKYKRRVVRFSRLYYYLLNFLIKRKKKVILVFILIFGIPLFLLPDKIEKKTSAIEFIRPLIENKVYLNYIHPNLKYLGGTLYGFLQAVDNNHLFNKVEETPSLKVQFVGSEGTTYEQMDNAVTKIETYIKSLTGIDHFETSLNSSKDALIEIFFKKKLSDYNLPAETQINVTQEVMKIGGIDFQVYGVLDFGFNNSINMPADQHITIEGYNLDRLLKIAENIRNNILLKQTRIHDIKIGTENKGFKLIVENENLIAEKHFTLKKLYNTVKDNSGNEELITNVNNESVVFIATSKQPIDLWNIKNRTLTVDSNNIKMSEVFKIKEYQLSNEITKVNKQYQIDLNYDFRGTYQYAKKVKEELIEEINKSLPIGYKALNPDDRYKNKPTSFFYITIALYVLLIIYFICAILFESLFQPFAIILTIPFSFIGVFLTFSIFNISFDEGGFASFLMLGGIVVNSAIYIVNELNVNGRGMGLNSYIRAFNHKIIPIILTIVSTILGLLPFVIWGENEFFWKSFASGTIGGLIFSLIVIIIFLPLCLKIKTNKNSYD